MDFATIKQLYIVLLGVGLIVGIVSRKKLILTVVGLLFGPMLLSIGWSIASSYLAPLSLEQQVETVLSVAAALLMFFLFGTKFGREVRTTFLATMMYDLCKSTAKAVFQLVIYLLQGLGRLLKKIWNLRGNL